MSVQIGAYMGSLSAADVLAGKGHKLGSLYTNHEGKVFVFVKASAAIAANDTCTFDETYQTVVAPISESNDAIGDKVGVAPAAIASGEYGWLQVYGAATVRTAAATAANVKLNTTATAGAVDDDNASAVGIFGMVLTTAAGSATTAPAMLNWPYQDLTIA